MQATSHTHVDFDIPLRSYLGLDIGHFVARNKHSSFVISILNIFTNTMNRWIQCFMSLCWMMSTTSPVVEAFRYVFVNCMSSYIYISSIDIHSSHGLFQTLCFQSKHLHPHIHIHAYTSTYTHPYINYDIAHHPLLLSNPS